MPKEKSTIIGFDEYVEELNKEDKEADVILDATGEDENWFKTAVENKKKDQLRKGEIK